ncbi:MAG: hypothetical protein U0Z26_06080 [Anaerolineales bacterium]
MKEIRPFHVLMKAVVLYAIANLAFAYFNPPIGKLSIYNWLVPGRERVPYEREVAYYLGSHTIPVYEDMDAMYKSTVMSQPKASDEYRVVLLGDSSAWGFQLKPDETLVGQINSLSLKTCDGKRIVAYNASFPLPYVMKDLILMDKVQEYNPDLYLWTITLDGFRNRTIFTNYFLDPYASRVRELVNQYQIRNLDVAKLSASTFWDRTIIGQRSRLKKIWDLQMHGFGWSATQLDYAYGDFTPLSNDQSDSNLFIETPPGKLNPDSMLFDVLQAGYQLAGKTPVIVINEPIFIATGVNSNLRYNEFYPRWAYDEYLTYLDKWMEKNGHDYVNAWNLLPPSEFTDTPFHRTPVGEQKFAELLKDKIEQLSCSK